MALAVPDFLALPGLRGRPARRSNRIAGLLAGLSAREAGEILTGLRVSRHELQWIAMLVGTWQAHGAAVERALAGAGRPDDRQVRTWVAAIGRLNVGAFMRLASAVWSARRVGGGDAPKPTAVHSLHRRMIHSAFRDAIDLGSLAIDGDDLRRAGIPAGPGLGKILQALLAAVLLDPSRNDADWLLEEAVRLSSTNQ